MVVSYGVCKIPEKVLSPCQCCKALTGVDVWFGYSTAWKLCGWGEGQREKEV